MAAFPEADKFLEQARKNPSPMLQQRHREVRETITQFFDDESRVDEALREFKRDWKPTDPVN
jgi:hypothetical protein